MLRSPVVGFFLAVNWLAHLYLSEPSAAFRLGNLLPDMVDFRTLAAMPEEYQPGIRRHRLIDAYTDGHPIFKQSILRLGPSFRRYGGVLIDIFYDHILAREWDSFAQQPLPEFAAEVYASFEERWTEIPPAALPRLSAMCRTDWLCSYREIRTIGEALRRIGGRFRKPVDLGPAAMVLDHDYEAFSADFREFFPQLVARVEAEAEE